MVCAASKIDLKEWFAQGQQLDATHMIVVCDTDQEDYPVFVGKNKDVRVEEKKYEAEGQRIMEVYSLSLDMDAQMAEHRAFHYD